VEGPDGGRPAGHALGRSRGGRGTKLHLLTDGAGLPAAFAVTAGQTHESKSAEGLFDAVAVRRVRGGPRRRPEAGAGDKAYSSPALRRALRRRGIRPVIPTRSNEPPDPGFDPAAYRRRGAVERCVARLKEYRRLATRYEKLAARSSPRATSPRPASPPWPCPSGDSRDLVGQNLGGRIVRAAAGG
jgi:transposase